MAEKADVINPGVNEERMEELREDIEHTRSDMHKTVSALQDKLSPSRVKSEIQDRVKEATVGRAKRATDRAREMGSTFVDVIRDNPIPAFLGGIGLGWLIVRGLSRGDGLREIPSEYLGRETYREGNYTEESHSEEEPGMGKQLYEKAADIGGQASEKARQFSGRAGEKVRQFSDTARRKVSETRGTAAARARELSSRVKEKASDYYERAGGTATRARSYFVESLESNPFGVALAFFALGIAAGLAVPASEKERELGEQVASKTRETARTTIEKVRSVAEEAKESSKRKAKEEGLL